MILPDASILECIALFNKYSNSAVPSYYSLPLSDEDKQEIVDNVYEAYSIYTAIDVEKNTLEANKRHGDVHINFVKVIWKVFRDALPHPTIGEDYQVPTIPPEPDPDPIPHQGYGALYNYYAINKTDTRVVGDPEIKTVYGALYNWYAVTKGIETTTADIYGALYNWYAATNVHNIAPTGWHVPTRIEWETMVTLLGGKPISGGKLKAIGITYWEAPNLGATDEVLFNAKGGGLRNSSGAFILQKYYNWTWTSSLNPPTFTNGQTVSMNYNSTAIITDINTPNNWGAPIRLIKDDSIDPGTVTDFDGNIYPTVKIGTQVWMAENLRATKYNDGSSIPEITDNAIWAADIVGARCYYNNTLPGSGVALLPPAGWHVPTHQEMTALREYIDPINSDPNDNDAGGPLKEGGFVHWLSPNLSATNSTGFSARGAGTRGPTGTFTTFKSEFSMFNSNDVTTDYAGCGTLAADIDNFITAVNVMRSKLDAVSVRFIKDDSNDPGYVTDYDGNIYYTIKINDQVWMSENFKCEHYNDGTDIPIVQLDLDWAALVAGDDAMCYYGADTTETFYLFPSTGWHVPTNADFETLIAFLGGASSGGAMKEEGTDHWTTPNTGATNTSGFTAISDGTRSQLGIYSGIGTKCDLWASNFDNVGGTDRNGIRLMYNSAICSFTYSNLYALGKTVRQVKDNTILADGETGFMFDIDGNAYNTVCIGTQEWMASDLNVIHYNNGTLIPNITDNTDWSNDVTGAMCWYDDAPYVPPIIVPPQMPQYYIVTDGVAIYRKGIRGGAFVIDVALTPLAFGGIEDIDWTNLQMTI